MTALGIILIVLSLPTFKMGFGALKDKNNHLNYGVESPATHGAFSWLLIAVGAGLACGGGALLAG